MRFPLIRKLYYSLTLIYSVTVITIFKDIRNNNSVFYGLMKYDKSDTTTSPNVTTKEDLIVRQSKKMKMILANRKYLKKRKYLAKPVFRYNTEELIKKTLFVEPSVPTRTSITYPQSKFNNELPAFDLRILFPRSANFADKSKRNRSGITSSKQLAVGKDFDRIPLQMDLNFKSKKRKVILLYYFDRYLNMKQLDMNKCKVNNCEFSSNEKDFQRADAVIFKQIPINISRPKLKSDQLWIYHSLESPLNTKPIPVNILINWTATYRRDSDLCTPYGRFRKYKYNNKLQQNNEKNFAVGKSKMVAWFVSNCKAKNSRLEYALALKKYIDVDIYGRCGSKQCGNNCNEMLKADYKFYLAFENSNCRDYITEKFFNALRNNVIPIVMGAHPDDYKAIAPPNSFIHVEMFNNLEELAKYIKVLSEDDQLYNNYFRWKYTGEFINTKYICRLCAMMQISHLVPKSYNDVGRWWKKDQCKHSLKWDK